PDDQVREVERGLRRPRVDAEVERDLAGQPDRPGRAAFEPRDRVVGVLRQLEVAWSVAANEDPAVEPTVDEVARLGPRGRELAGTEADPHGRLGRSVERQGQRLGGAGARHDGADQEPDAEDERGDPPPAIARLTA